MRSGWVRPGPRCRGGPATWRGASVSSSSCVVLTVERRLGISLFWSVAWGIVITIVLTRLICSRISHERPLTSVTDDVGPRAHRPPRGDRRRGRRGQRDPGPGPHRAAPPPAPRQARAAGPARPRRAGTRRKANRQPTTVAEAPGTAQAQARQRNRPGGRRSRCSDVETSAGLSGPRSSPPRTRPTAAGRVTAGPAGLPAPARGPGQRPAPCRRSRHPAKIITRDGGLPGPVPARGRTRPQRKAQPTSARGAVHSHVHADHRRPEHRRSPAAQRTRRVRVVPARAAALVVPVRLAAPGPDRRDRGPVRRAGRPLAAPARHDPAVPDPHVGRGPRAQRGQPAARRAGRAVLRRLPDR